MNKGIKAYIHKQSDDYRIICEVLAKEIIRGLPKAENKLWHGHPVWFIEGNPTVGFSIEKPGVRLMFWSGADFGEPELKPGSGKFKDASIFYNSVDEVTSADIQRWLEKSQKIQWNYKDIRKNKGKLSRIE